MAHVCQALPGGASRSALWQPPASGPVRSPPLVCRSGILSASAPAAASQAPCVPDAPAAAFHIPSVAAAAASRRAPATRHTATGSTLPPRACARHSCIAPSGERLTSTAVGLTTGPPALPPGVTVVALRYGRRRALRRGITAEGLPHAILTAQACCGVAVAGPPPLSNPQCGSPTAATNSATCSRSRRVLRTPYRLRNRHATRRCGMIITSARVAGLDGRCQSLRFVAAARHPDRYGPRRSLTAVAFRRPAHRPPRRRLLACRMRSPPFPHSQCGSRRLRQSACHDAGRGRWQPCRRSAVFARGYTPQPAHPPSVPAAARPRPASIKVIYRAS